MSAPPEHLALAAEFPAVTRDQWRAMVGKVLAKSGVAESVDPELALASTTYDGIRIKPLYTADDSPPAATPPPATPQSAGGPPSSLPGTPFPAATGLPGHAPFVRGSSVDGAPAPAGTSASATPTRIRARRTAPRWPT